MERVFFVNDMSNGGAERVISNLLNENDILIQIWDNNFYKFKCKKRIVLIKRKGFFISDVLISVIKLFFLVKVEKFNKINSHLFLANYINTLVSLFTNHISICTHCVSFESKFRVGSASRILHKFLIKYLLRFSHLNTYKSKDMMVEYNSLFNLKNGCVIYNPINVNICKSNVQSTSFDFEFVDNITYILVVGRFHETKNQLAILKTLKFLDDKYQFIFLGDGNQLLKCIEYCKENGLSSRAHFLGSVSDPYPFYMRCQLYMSVSLSEGFPNSLIEAIAFDCFPIVYNCNTGPKEILSCSYSELTIKNLSGFELYNLGILLNDLNSSTIIESVDFAQSFNCKVDKVSKDKLFEKLTYEIINSKYYEL
ncbi:glycosyltransferase [Shewanella basaltis]|uniref:glycosyltransferase n=1 Tax=Shewanella basaltis TaxID=472183 RepID=UPI0020105AE3|nr:glycosyltransferase [Shewanella basaltis]MCL1112990.1 glycosyltransferase [Shewanella basaltis]